MPDLNPSQYTDSLAYFDLLKTSAVVNGAPKDKFHFTYPTTQWQSISTSGQDVTYGLSFALISTTPPRRAVVAYVEPGAPVATVNGAMTRGVEILTVDGVDLVSDTTQAGVDKINAGLFPSTAGETHTFQVKELNGTTRSVTLQAAVVASKPVLVSKVLTIDGASVGYLLFNDHIATAESQLFNAITSFKQQGIQDLVLDMRYNGGGFLDIASELAYMIAGPTATAGQTFEKLQYNDKYPNTNPVSGGALTPTPFYNRSRGIDSSLPANTALPALSMQRVFVLTGDTTCSASESVINGLRGVNVPVYQIGTTTCGKPYGFYPTDNCGTTYFSIQFRGVNAKNYGEYTNGFSPVTTSMPSDSSQITGCVVNDDFTHALGDVAEKQLSAALAYRVAGSCAVTADEVGTNSLSSARGLVVKPEWRMNRVIRD